MPPFRRLSLTVKALSELGPGAMLLYGRYRLGLHSGTLRRKTPPTGSPADGIEYHPLHFLSAPGRETLAALLGDARADLLRQADEIARGQARLFGGEAGPLELAPPGPPAHWTEYALGRAVTGAQDVKLVWEPGRFGWALTLARAYRLTGDDRHARSFWGLAERFLEANPPYIGPHWESAQETAIRLICLAFAFQVLRESPETSATRDEAVTRVIAAHAGRIPPTLNYARAQDNNHLLAEAAALLTAGAVLPGHPEAPSWKDLGWRWLNRGLQAQIAGDGSYVQQSANYHRLMLQIALWGAAAARSQGLELEPETRRRLAAAVRWALALLDPHSGRLPNLGPNDGSQLLPLAAAPYSDHRPTLAAAALAFLGERPFPPGPWDELGLWLGLQDSEISRLRSPLEAHPQQAQPRVILRNPASESWAYLRVEQFTHRPGHADLLHLDLWRGGLNLAQDAGTYLYNAAPPWDNALARTAVHNTVTVGGEDQMTRAGRFLWLGWPDCGVRESRERTDGSLCEAEAYHDGYRRLGAIHQRTVEAHPDGSWTVEDLLSPAGSAPERAICARLHWLLQDWPWSLDEQGSAYLLRLESPQGPIRLGIEAASDGPGPRSQIQLARAGELLAGEGQVDPTQGWASNTYASKNPALSLALVVEGTLPIRFISEWVFD